MLEHGVDIVLAGSIAVVAWRVLLEPQLFRSMVLFIAMGLMLSLAWVRLAAPDIALAEAAIGAGLTGILLIRAAQTEAAQEAAAAAREAATSGWRRWFPGAGRIVSAAAALAFAAVLLVAVIDLPGEPIGLTEAAATEMEASGVEHPVTSVLLNFRAYDTWLEVGVLLLAAMGVLAIHRTYNLRSTRSEEHTMLVLTWLARIILPLAVLIAGYLYWSGTHQPGGAFQAGAILAAALVLMQLAGFRGVSGLSTLWLGAGLMLSFAAFLAVGFIGTFEGEFLRYRHATGELIILALELTIVVSTAVTLAALFAGAGSQSGDDSDAVRARTPPESL